MSWARGATRSWTIWRIVSRKSRCSRGISYASVAMADMGPRVRDDISRSSANVSSCRPAGYRSVMGYAAWLLVIAAGAIVRYAIADSVDGVDLQLIGLILIVVGIVGFFVSLITFASRRRDYEVGRDPYPPAP